MTLWQFLAAEWPAILCFVFGIALVTLEMFLPGIGLPGIAGGVLLILGIILGAQNATQAILLSLATVAILILLFVLTIRSATKGRLSRSSLILRQSSSKEEGYTANEEAEPLLGREGVAVSELRPSGIAEIAGKRYDVVSDGTFLARGSRVTVSEIAGRRITVRPTEAPPSPDPPASTEGATLAP